MTMTESKGKPLKVSSKKLLPDYEYLMGLRQGLLAQVHAIEIKAGVQPTTAELRRERKRKQDEATANGR